MAYNISHEPENNIVLIEYTGDVSIEDLSGAAKKSYALKQEHSSARFLTEFLNTRLVFSIDELIEFSRDLHSIGIDKNDRTAIVLVSDNEDDLKIHLRVFGAGADIGNVTVFYDRQEALDWLLF